MTYMVGQREFGKNPGKNLGVFGGRRMAEPD